MTLEVDANTRRRENIEWCRRCLAEEYEFPPPDAGLPIEERLADEWVGPFGLMYLLGGLRRFNKSRGFSSENLVSSGNQIKLEDRYEHAWSLTFDFDRAGRISAVELDTTLAGGLEIREARAEDFEVIERLSNATPIPVEGGTCQIETHGSLGPATELRGNLLLVVEDQGEVIAVGGAASVPIMVGSNPYHVTYSNHFRIEQRARGKGLMFALIAGTENPFRPICEGTISVFHAGNALGTIAFPWKTGGCRVVLNCAGIAGDPFGEPATKKDEEAICAMINNAHGGQEWFLPYDRARLEERLSRSPDAYGWSNFRVSERAVVGSWFSGEMRHYVVEGREWTETRGAVLDYGFDECGMNAGEQEKNGRVRGGLEELELLLRSVAADALKEGISHLTLFTAEQAPAYALLERLSESIEPYYVSCSIPEPEGTEKRGVYIDQVLA